MSDLLIRTDRGVFCPAGGFHIDPWRPTGLAIVTHAHADHLRPGAERYLTCREGEPLLRHRLGRSVTIEAPPYGEPLRLGHASVSLHPAGHVLGSAQVRVQVGEQVWVVTGDFKTASDPTCRPFEPVPCDVLISEATFALPVFRWPDEKIVFDQIHQWWRDAQQQKRTCVLLAYSLGKAQRILAGLDPSIGPVLVHGAVHSIAEIYRQAGVALPDAPLASEERAAAARGRAMVVAPPSVAGTAWLRKFGDVTTAMASGWMRIRGNRRRRNLDRGFVFSDHADWPGLLSTIEQTGAQRVGATHGYARPLTQYLRERGYDSFQWATPCEGESPRERAAASAGERA